ncbi:hypothetical protein AB1N83_000066 [Pleurotus pulmonarius]
MGNSFCAVTVRYSWPVLGPRTPCLLYSPLCDRRKPGVSPVDVPYFPTFASSLIPSVSDRLIWRFSRICLITSQADLEEQRAQVTSLKPRTPKGAAFPSRIPIYTGVSAILLLHPHYTP